MRERLRPELERRLRDAGYVVMFWGDAGWVRYFSSTPDPRPPGPANLRVYASSGDPESVEMMKDYYTPVVLEPDQILLGLRNGMIDALPVPGVPGQLQPGADLRAVHARPALGTDHRCAGASPNRAWNQLDAATQAWLRETSRARRPRECASASRAEDEQAVQAMKDKQGSRWCR